MDKTKILNDVKTMLSIEKDESDLDEKLDYMVRSIISRLKILINGVEPPDEMSYIVVEVALVRFNRIGSEGLKSHSVEGESLQFTENDFANYMEEIEAFNYKQSGKKGGLRFL